MATSARLRPVLRSKRQVEYRAATEQIAGFVGGRGSGKTRIGAEDVVLRARNGHSWMSVSPSYPIIHETTLPTVIEVCEQLGVLRRVVKSPVPRVIFRTQDGGVADLVFRTGEHPEKLRGPSKAGLWFDEASIMHEDCFKLGLPVLRHKGIMGPCRMTFTPKGRQHWTFNVFFERVDEANGYFRDQGGVLYFCQVNAEGGLQSRRVHSFSGVSYVQRPGTRLVQSHTLENPFLPPQFFDVIRGQYSTLLAQQELAGDFVDIEGLMFRREWFHAVDFVPKDCSRARYWDRAATQDAGDYSAGVLMARDTRGRYYVEDVVRGQWSYHARDEVIRQTAERDALRYGNSVVIYIEQEGGSGGKEAAEQAVIKLAGFPVYVDIVSGARKRVKDKIALPGEGKVVRAMPLAAQAEAGNVFYIRDAAWVEDWIAELIGFPEVSNDDQVDASSGAFNKLAGSAGFYQTSIQRVDVASSHVAGSKYGVKLNETPRGRFRFGKDKG